MNSSSYAKYKFVAFSNAGVGNEDNVNSVTVYFLLKTDSINVEDPFAVYTMSENLNASDMEPDTIS